jgi:hypothetical protein
MDLQDQDWFTSFLTTICAANIGYDGSEKRIKCADFEGFTPIS